MITILDGKLTIPENERFIGFAGDNLKRKIEFLIKNQNTQDKIYRIYLTFDDGTCNYFTLPAAECSDGVKLTWNVLSAHIFKSGNVRVQIKAFSDNGVIYHTTSDTFIVGSSAEFTDRFTESNAEFLEYERRLNEIAETISEICVLTPYIGENGNWYIFDSSKGSFVDSGKPSVGTSDTVNIKNGAVTSDKLASGAVTSTKFGQWAVVEDAIHPDAVTTAKIKDGNVTSAKLADGSVTTVKLADKAVTGDKIAEKTVQSVNINQFAVGNKHLVPRCVDSSKIGENAVNSDNINQYAVLKDKLAPKCVDSSKLDDGAIDNIDKFSAEFIADYLSLPIIKKTTFGVFSASYYNTLTAPGIYQLDSNTGIHQVLIVLKPDSDSYLMQIRMSHYKIEYRGILCSTGGVYADDDWGDWKELGGVVSTDDIADKSVTAEKLALEYRDIATVEASYGGDDGYNTLMSMLGKNTSVLFSGGATSPFYAINIHDDNTPYDYQIRMYFDNLYNATPSITSLAGKTYIRKVYIDPEFGKITTSNWKELGGEDPSKLNKDFKIYPHNADITDDDCFVYQDSATDAVRRCTFSELKQAILADVQNMLSQT